MPQSHYRPQPHPTLEETDELPSLPTYQRPDESYQLPLHLGPKLWEEQRDAR